MVVLFFYDLTLLQRRLFVKTRSITTAETLVCLPMILAHFFLQRNPPDFALLRMFPTRRESREARILWPQIIGIFAARARGRNQTFFITFERE
jgi:hypothetical protein